MQGRLKILPWLNLAAGLVWIWVGLRNFDRLRLLDVYHLPHYRRIPQHPQGAVLLPCVAGLLFLIAAIVGFLKRHRDPEVTTILSESRS